jgi:hypothetical protein
MSWHMMLISSVTMIITALIVAVAVEKVKKK